MMGSVSSQTNTTLKNLIAKLSSRFKLGSLRDWLSVILVFFSLGVVAWSFEKSRWTNPQPSYILTLGLAVLLAMIVTLTHLRNKIGFPLMIFLGLLITVWQSSATIIHYPGDLAIKIWWQIISSNAPSENSLYFIMFLILLTWLFSFISAWFVLKKRNPWITFLLGSVMLLVNLNNLPIDYYYFLPLFIVAILLLIFQVNLAKQGDWFSKYNIRKSFRNIIYLLITVLCAVSLIVGLAWFVPEPDVSQIGIKLDTSSLHNVDPSKNWFNIFAKISSKWPWVESKKRETLLFKSPIETGEMVNYVITSSQPAYWLVRRYDTYDAWGWTDTSEATREINPGVSADNIAEYPYNVIVSYTVENKVKTDVILTRGEFVSADISVLLKTMPIDSDSADILSVISPRVLSPYQRYTVTDNVPSFTIEELGTAGNEYPEWVVARYLQLPENFPGHVKTLSNDLTKNAFSPLEKFTAIKEYLNQFQYDQNSVAPSDTEDGVALFLYSTKKGNCLNFASSMAVMLRSSGVPARLCTGYLRGDLDPQTGEYIVRSRHYHAWVEVYFPGYGWIEFETTPSGGVSGGVDVSGEGASFGYVDELPPWMEEEENQSGITPVEPAPYKGKTEHWGWLYWVIAAVLVGIGYAIRRMLDSRVDRLKRVKNAAEAYNRMCRLAAQGNLGPRAQETPLEYAKRLAMVLPGEADYIDSITRSYIDTLYSSRKELIEGFEKSRLQKSWAVLCVSLIRYRMRFRKWVLLRVLWRPT
jgi:transglutaminase-like putative cysteine protease